MGQNNRDIDELLNFDYSKQEEDNGSSEIIRGRVARATMTSLEDSEAYAEVRKASSRAVSQQDSAERRAAAVRAEREARAQETARQRAEAHAREIERRRAEEQARIARAKQAPDERAKAEYARLRAESQAKEQSRQQARREEYLRLQAEVEARERARQEALRRQAEEQARKEYLRQQAEAEARERTRQEALRQQAEAEARERARQETLRQQTENETRERARQEALRQQAEARAREEAEANMRAEARRMAEERLRAERAQHQAAIGAGGQSAGHGSSRLGANGVELEDGLNGAVRSAPLELPEQESRAEVVARAAEKKAKEKARITKKTILKNLTSSGGNKGSSWMSAVAGSEGGLNRFARYLSMAYGVIAAVFAGVILYMDVLPTSYLIALAIIMVLLSAIVIRQLNKTKIKMWGRVFSMVLALMLIVVYGMGSVYALGTLSFLGSTSVKNENRVASITEDPFNVVITGMDVSGKVDTEGRSDVNMVLTVNPKTGVILMTSIPRDYEIRLPDKDYATDKLTHTGFYGVDSTLQAEADLLDIKTNYYVKVNFTTVKVFINSIGGIDVYSDYEFRPVKRSWFLVKKGWNHMNGKEALAFARERKAFLEGDNQRVKNQQRVFEAILKKATDSKTMVLKYNQVMNDMKDYFEMSFSSREIRSLLKMQLAKGTDWKVYKNTLEGFPANKATYTGGSQLLYVTEQNPESVAHAQALIKAVMNGDKIKKDKDGNVQVEGTESDESSGESA